MIRTRGIEGQAFAVLNRSLRLKMTFGKNRLDLIANLEGRIDSAGVCSTMVATESFVADFRPVLSNFLASELDTEPDIDSVLEETFEHFRHSINTSVWHESVKCRIVVEKLLFDVLRSRDVVRSGDRKLNQDGGFGVEFGADFLGKRFAIVWRDHIVSEGWFQLKRKELKSGRPYYTVLASRYEKPWLSNSRLLDELRCVFSTLPSKQSFRVFLIRCEQKLAHNVVSQVTNTIHRPNRSAVRSEMKALDLSHFWERVTKSRTTARLAKLI